MSRVRISFPPRSRSQRFVLTPLADAMFQLLIFFMLTSSLTPYSLLTLQSAPDRSPAPQPGGGPAPTLAPAPAAQPQSAIWSLARDSVTVGGQRFGLDDLDRLVVALAADPVPVRLILLVRETARVEDVARVLARLHSANVAGVRIAGGAL